MSYGHHADERDTPGYPEHPRFFFAEPSEDLGPCDPADDDEAPIVADPAADWCALDFSEEDADRDWLGEQFALEADAWAEAGRATGDARSHRLIRHPDHPEAFVAVLLIGQDPADLDGAESWASEVLEEFGPLPGVAWIALHRGRFALLDNDRFAEHHPAFDGHTPIALAALLDSGIEIPREAVRRAV